MVSKVNTVILAESDGVVSRIHAGLGQRVSRRQKVMTIRHTDPVYQYAPVTVAAPTSGVVSLVDVSEGSHVVRGQKLAAVTDPAQVRVAVEVPAQDLALLKAGMAGEFKVPGGDRRIGVRVRGLSPFVDPATGTASGELELDKGAALPPGLLGQVSFKAGARQGFSVPEYAVIYRGNDTFVRVVEDGKARQVPVTVGRRQRGEAEIVQGLKADARLVLRASRYVADGEAVTAEESSR